MSSKRTRKVRNGLVAVIAALALLMIGSQPVAAAEPIYPVMNTSEYPPDGIYFRNSPNWDDAIRVPGHGVFAGDQVRLKCWQSGSNVPRLDGGSNTVWYNVDNVTRPTSPQGANTGWINAHFVNDGTGPNQVAPGMVQCGTAPPPPPPPSPTPVPIAGFYSPFNQGERAIRDFGRIQDLRDQSGIDTAYKSMWQDWGSNCPAVSTTPYFALHGQLQAGEYLDRVGGWSGGRLGPTFLIQGMYQYDPNLLRSLNYVILIDPGNYSELSGCDARDSSGSYYAQWLKYHTGARLVILSGKITQESSSKGIQEIYFNPIRNQAAGTNIRSRVTVCNYNMDHYEIYRAGQYWIKNKIGSTCPTLNLEGKRWAPTAKWNP